MPTQLIAPAAENATNSTNSTEGARPILRRSSQVTGGVSKKLSNTAKAKGISTSLPKYRPQTTVTAVMTTAKCDELPLRSERTVVSLLTIDRLLSTL